MENDKGDKGIDLDKGTITIVINGTQKTVSVDDLTPNGEISFDQVIQLAFGESSPSGPNIVFTVSYRNGAGRPGQGSLSEGGLVKIQKGTVFNASYTDKS